MPSTMLLTSVVYTKVDSGLIINMLPFYLLITDSIELRGRNKSDERSTTIGSLK